MCPCVAPDVANGDMCCHLLLPSLAALPQRFDWFFKSRTPQELARRAETLIRLIEKEQEDEHVSGWDLQHADTLLLHCTVTNA